MRNRVRGGLGAVLLLISFLFCLFGMSHSALAEHTVNLNGYEIDVKGGEPVVPQDLEPQDEKNKKYKKWIVQFTGPIREADKQLIADLGCRLGDYLPDFAFIVSMSDKARKQVEDLSFVNGIVRFKPAYKIDKKLKDAAGAVIAEKGKKVMLNIKLDGKDSQPVVLNAVHKKKGKVLDMSGDIVRVEVDQADIAQFSHMEEVLWIEEATELYLLNDTSTWTIQTYAANDTRIWDKGIHGEGQIVAIGDTGLDYDMPWFIDPVGAAIGPTHRKIVGYDTTYGDDYDANSPGHGTHVAGTVGGDQTPVTGSSATNGMAPKSRFYIQDITPGSSNAVYPPSDLGLMFIKAYEAGARLHTNSWGGGGSAYNSMCMSADKFMWEHKDFLALFANGNAGPGTGTVGYPAAAKNVVSVGATLNGAGAESVTWFSSNGPTADGRIKPTITAPGDGVTDAAGIISADSDGIKNSNNSGTIGMRGTSMATPATAGAAALVRQYYTEGYYPGGAANSADAFTPSAALVKATLMNSAQNMTGSYIDAVIPSTGQGWGRINLSNTLVFSGDTKAMEIVDDSAGLATGENWSQTYFAADGQPLKVTLVGTDYPGTVGASKAIVNDLDLTVTAPDGFTTYLGNVFSNGESVTGGSADRLNVEEQVLIKTPIQGVYTVTVTAYNIPNGPQPFALVVTGASSVTSKGFITLNKTRYNVSGAMAIKLADRDLNLSSTDIDEASVTISSTTEPGGEQVRLVETGLNTGIFTGSASLRLGAPVPNDGYLDVAEGDIITATYNDANDGTGNPAIATDTAIVDITAPLVSAVTTTAFTDSSATVNWTTNESADSVLNYGETAAKGAFLSDYRLAAQHTLNLTNLKEATTYFFEARSTDEAGNLAVDDNGGMNYSFTTINVPPDLTVNSSNGSETYLDRTVIYGTVIDHSGVVSVTVNDQPATYRSSDGYYELEVLLTLGDNSITVVATDALGNARTLTTGVRRLQPPDLVMSSVSCPTTGATGGTVTIADTVCNNDTGDSKAFVVGLYFSTDAAITSSDMFIGSRSIPSLTAGACSSGETTVTIPSSMNPGFYSCGAIADYNQIQIETNEDNNSLAGNQIALQGPDLNVTAVSGPIVAKTGEAITVTNTVANTSSLANAGGFYVGMYLSTDDVITTADTFLGYRYVSNLAAGTSNSEDTSVTVPGSIIGGSYYIGAIADIYNYIGESDKTNNSLAGNQIAITGADLAMSSVSGPITAKTGEAITVSNTVTASASGGGASGFYVGMYLSTDNVITTSDIYIGRRYISSIVSGASDVADTSITIPSSVGSGTYYIGAIADIYSQVAESDETNNTLAGNPIAVTGADLTMSAVSGPTAAKTGEAITVSNTVTASASGGGATGFYVGMYLSTDDVITTSDLFIGNRYVASLAPGASDAADTSITVPSSVGSGTYYIGAIADYANQVKESDETNNSLAGNPIAVTGADLTMSAVSGPTAAKTGEAITVSNTVTASASGGGATGFYVGMYLSTDDVITTSDLFIGNRYIASLAPGASDAADTSITVPSSIGSGTYYIGAIADYNNSVAESDETNNAKTGNQVTLTGADLTMTVVSAPAIAKTGEAITVSNTVAASASGGGATGFYVGIYLSADADITTADTRVAYRYVSSLAAGASDAADTAVTIPSSIAGGTYYIGAIADYNNSVAESDETNNSLAGNQLTLTGADLTMTVVSAPAIAKTGEAITVSNTVAASASGGGATGFYVGIYLSTDADITTADTRVAYRYVSSLAAGASDAADTAATIPSSIAGGTYYIGAIADYADYVKESDETNNSLAGNPIAVTGADLKMSAVSGPTAAKTGEAITVSNTVTAWASGGGATGFYVGMYLSTDDVITTSDIFIGNRYIASLAPGASDAADTSITVPSSVGSGTYYIGAIADYANQVKESDETNNTLAGNPIAVTGADLTMSAVSGPVAAKTGEAITVSNTVTASASGGGATGFYVGIYLSADADITTADTRVAYRYVSSLAAGASDAADTAATIPSSIAGGTYYIGAIADFNNSVAESDETNNSLAGNQVTLTGADLTMTVVSAPAIAKTGEAITVSNAVTASASGGGATGFYVGMYLSTDDVITTSDLFIGNRYVASLAPGASDAADTSITVPSSVGSGTYYIGAIADYANQVKESDETNNSLAGNPIAVTGADLTMSAVSGPTAAKTGEAITVSNTVTASASGGGATGFYVGMYLSTDDVCTTSDILIGYRYVASLASGASDAADTSITVPSSVGSGSYYICGIADHWNYVVETDETNNAKTGNQIAITGADLAMSSVSGPTAAKTGEAIAVSNTVAASASGGGATGFYVGMYLSTDNVITTSDIYIGRRYVSSLASGASDVADTSITVPSSAGSGTYYIGAIADIYSQVAESDETNNSLAGNQIAVTGADLTMSAVSGPFAAKTGEAITVSNTVTASASGGGATGFYVGMYLSTDNVITTSDIYIGRRYVSSLASGASDVADTSITVPSSAGSGFYYFGAIADIYSQVAESDETNNSLAGNRIAINTYTVTPIAGPNGSIDPSTPQTVIYNETTSFTVTPDIGYHTALVTGCSGTLNGSVYTTGPVMEDCTVSATFAVNTYTVTPIAGPNGSIDPSTPQTVNYSQTALFSVSTYTGYHIASVTGCDGTLNGSVYTTGPVTADCTVTATFAVNTYTVTPIAGPNGSIEPSTPQTVNYSQTALFSISTYTGYHIASVTGCDGTLNGSVYTTGPVTADCTVTATFAINTYALTVTKTGAGSGTVTSSPAGISCGSSCSGTYDHGTVVTLSASSAADSLFAGWSGGGCSGTGTCVTTMDAAKTVTAAFNQYITVTAPNGGETLSRGGTYTITWTYAGNPGPDVKIELLKGGVVIRAITGNTSIGSNGSGSYSWKVSNDRTIGSDYTILITSKSNSNYKDTSNNYFTIQ